MLEEKKMADFADAKRLGKTFTEEKIMELYKHLEDSDLPIIPYNASIDELNRLLENIAGQYAYTQHGYGMLKFQERKLERAYQKAYIKAYRYAEQTMPEKTTQTVLKAVAEEDKDVVAAGDALTDVRGKLEIVDSRLKEYSILDQDVRKLLSSVIELMKVRMD